MAVAEQVAGPSARLLDVVVDLVAREGLQAVSVRRVATAAGVSIGAVQHHFPTKDAMLRAAAERVGAVVRERLLRTPVDDPAAAVRLIAQELSATGQGGREGTAVWLAFVARACSHSGLAELHAQEWREVEDAFTRLLAAAGGRSAATSADADAAATLLAVLDGVAIAVTTEPERMPVERAHRLVDAAVDRALAP